MYSKQSLFVVVFTFFTINLSTAQEIFADYFDTTWDATSTTEVFGKANLKGNKWMSSNAPALVILEKNKDTLNLAFSNPLHTLDKKHLILKTNYRSERNTTSRWRKCNRNKIRKNINYNY
jgi:hypothetical protein